MSALLAIETSGRSLGVALRDERGVVFEENVIQGAIHGKALAPITKKALDTFGLKPRDLAGVAVSLGPGSWTGLRIGLSFAKTLAWAAGIPLLGVSSFEALALEAARNTGLSNGRRARLTLRDARSEGYFIALFSETLESPQRWIEERVLQPAGCIAAVEEALMAHAQPQLGVTVCGDRVCLDALAEHAQSRGWHLLRHCEHITGGALAECGWQRLQHGEGLKSAAQIHELGPLYLRASDPELKLSASLADKGAK